MPILLLIAGYLLGSIPFGLLYGKMAGIDVRSQGSGNIGATNVNRLLGKKLGALTLASDIAKGILPMLLAIWLLGNQPDGQRWAMYAGAAAFLGHCFPLYLKFRGGKGVATALGIHLYLAPLPTLAAAAIFALTVRLSGYVSLGSLTAAALLPLLIWLSGAQPGLLPVSALVGAVIWFKHHDNLGRLWRGEEKSWKKADAQKRR